MPFSFFHSLCAHTRFVWKVLLQTHAPALTFLWNRHIWQVGLCVRRALLYNSPQRNMNPRRTHTWTLMHDHKPRLFTFLFALQIAVYMYFDGENKKRPPAERPPPPKMQNAPFAFARFCFSTILFTIWLYYHLHYCQSPLLLPPVCFAIARTIAQTLSRVGPYI